MIANPAMIFDFSRERDLRKHIAGAGNMFGGRPPLSIDDAQRRLAQCCAWLGQHGIGVDGFAFSTLSDPVVYVPPTRQVWALFSGRVRSKGQRQSGNKRLEVFEGQDEHNIVNVRWEEVSICA